MVRNAIGCLKSDRTSNLGAAKFAASDLRIDSFGFVSSVVPFKVTDTLKTDIFLTIREIDHNQKSLTMLWKI